ncbi:MAG: AI-2E family transporter [Limnochordia bacterium]|jgi:sporulation integral membrane protein YtvI
MILDFIPVEVVKPLSGRRLFLYLLALGGLLFLYWIRGVLTPFLFAIIIVYVANPLVGELEAKEIPRTLAIVIVYLFFILVAGALSAWLLPPLREQTEQFLASLPQQAERWEYLARVTLRDLQRIDLPPTVRDSLFSFVDGIQRGLELFARRMVELVVNLLGRAFSLVLAPIIAFYILRDLPAIREQFLLFISPRRQAGVEELLADINDVLHGFIRGQVLVSAVVGALIGIGLSLLGVRYALLIGVVAGMFDVIPYFGPIIAIMPAMVLASFQSPLTILWVILLFIGVNQVESSILAPKIMGDRVGLHPLVVIAALLIGGELMGIIGLLIGVPLAAISKVLLLYWFKILREV